MKIAYRPEVAADLAALPLNLRRTIINAIERRLADRPELFGKPLRGQFFGWWRLRVGDYRIIFRKESSRLLIAAIIQRKDAYRKGLTRFHN